MNKTNIVTASDQPGWFFGYIRYTKDNVFVSETRSLGVTVYDKRAQAWVGGGGFEQSMRRDRTNDDL